MNAYQCYQNAKAIKFIKLFKKQIIIESYSSL